MKKIINVLAVLILLSFVLSCKTTSETVRTHFVKDSTVINHSEFVQLPTQIKLTFNEPCSKDSLKPFEQTLEQNGVRLSIKTEGGAIVAEMETDSIISTKTEVTKSVEDVKTESIKKIIRVPYLPKWIFYSIGLNILLLIWIFKKPILKILKIWFPFLPV